MKIKVTIYHTGFHTPNIDLSFDSVKTTTLEKDGSLEEGCVDNLREHMFHITNAPESILDDEALIDFQNLVPSNGMKSSLSVGDFIEIEAEDCSHHSLAIVSPIGFKEMAHTKKLGRDPKFYLECRFDFFNEIPTVEGRMSYFRDVASNHKVHPKLG